MESILNPRNAICARVRLAWHPDFRSMRYVGSILVEYSHSGVRPVNMPMGNDKFLLAQSLDG